MNASLRVAGVGMVPFARPGRSDTYGVMVERAVRAALADARLDGDLVDTAVAGYVYADACAGERALHRVGISGIPVMRVKDHCASGSSALYHARQAVLSGEAECALAVGFEEMPPAAIELSLASHPDERDRHRNSDVEAMRRAETERALQRLDTQLEWMATDLGVSDEAFAAVAVKARAHARHNPYAILRDPLTIDDVLAGPTVRGRLRTLYTCAPSSGAAAVIVCTPAFAARHGLRSDVAILSHVMAGGAATELEGDSDALGAAATRRAAALAYQCAGVGPQDIDVAELHDCSVGNEMVSCAALGFCADDGIEQFVRSGANTHGGDVVVCPSGGMLSNGHPPGATGLAQICELTWQLRHEAGERQVAGARTALGHNGGLGRAVSIAILQRR